MDNHGLVKVNFRIVTLLSSVVVNLKMSTVCC